MTINQRNCGSDSRMVKALLEQVSGLQEDVAVLDSQIDDLSGTKANKADIAVSVSTKKLTADTATIGEGTVNRLHSSEVDTNGLHATETITNRLEVNGSADIANLSADALTAKDLGTTNLNAVRMKATEKIEVGEGVAVSGDTVKAPMVEANKVKASQAELSSVRSESTVTGKLDVSGKTTVKDLDITGEITGLNNVDIDAKSIVTPIIEANEVVAGSIYTSKDNRLHPTPGLDNNDYYIIALPPFTGNMVLNWVDRDGNTVWSASVTGNGEDYGFTWSTASRDSIKVAKLYQYDRRLYIKTTANGDLEYSYHATEKLGEIGIGFNGVAGWTNPKSLDDLADGNHRHECTTMDGTVVFGLSYIPGFTTNIDRYEIDELLIDGENIVGTQTVKGSIDESLAYRVTQHTYDYSESAFSGRFYEVAPFMESDQIPEGAKLIYNDNGTLKFTTSLPPHSGLQFGSPEIVVANKEWFNGIEWMPETVALADFTYSTPTIKVGNDREVATQEVQSFVDYRENATDALLDSRSAETAAKLKAETERAIKAESTLQASIEAEKERATTAESTLHASIEAETERATTAEENLDEKKQDKLPNGEKDQVLTSNGDGTISWKTSSGSGFVPPVGMVVELEESLNPNDLFTGEWIELQENK